MEPRILVIEHEADAHLGYFAEWLGLPCDIVRPYLGDPVPPAPEGAGLIVLGGEPSADEDDRYPWLRPTRALLRRAVEAEVPTLGICLGAQLLTLACGGEVRPGSHGLETGLLPVRRLPAADADPLMRGVPATALAVQWHKDAMTRLPEGAVPLATGDVYPAQAYRLGSCAWAVQFHPEATYDIYESWMAGGAHKVTAAGLDPQRVLAQVKQVTDTWRPLAAAFADAVRAAAASR
ncbi:type 1 glutamine amidotransferase [Bailinhaonella thermotolerans]|uniref:Type 1 glutamine amidotransferase n=1 Tax=Bailinhaonella thermotolerans TaxID=1070861 RepID=A0A3A4BE37_9ACTN|nr:type 1 glutamine amidotransferase [Bailinhaonella thermotolerans]RJL32560.1 type 1 glutamine amidotransferase [Bailinhaonella thermotolerans]